MRIALGSDAKTEVTSHIEAALKKNGNEVALFGALASDNDSWPEAARSVGEAVTSGKADTGIVCCWTGTGVSIAANKVPGIRAALCGDAQTAAGAREWNDANVLALSLRTTTTAIADEILDAWFSTAPTTDAKYRAMISTVEKG